ncbi:MAG TPA: replication-relaxation family protein, partial [Ktedonobacteraceae bacterium]|nr:replication-relaxation family protein [Ktedonobacteraceae bacterium]
HLRWWESGTSCARRFSWKGRWHSFQPDACAEYQNAGQSAFRFWLEWDQGTMNVRDLERKCANYAAYLDARAWSCEHLTLPLLLFVVPDIDQERRVSRCAREVLRNARLPLYLSTRELMRSQGLDAPIWQRVHLQAERLAVEGGRVALFAG